MKTCNKCLKEKNNNEFDLDRGQCKVCRLEYKKSLPKKNFPVSVTEKCCSNCQIIKSAENFNPDKAYTTGLYPYCRPCVLIKQKEKYARNPEKYKNKSAERYDKLKGTEQLKAPRRARQKERLATDPLYKLKRRLRNRLYCALRAKSWKKSSSIFDYLGCSIEELKLHLEKQFQSGMSWDNQGEWHIDHITPLDSAQTEEELYKLNHYTNLQPLWGIENIKKGTRI